MITLTAVIIVIAIIMGVVGTVMIVRSAPRTPPPGRWVVYMQPAANGQPSVVADQNHPV
jgi:hypothetical protein